MSTIEAVDVRTLDDAWKSTLPLETNLTKLRYRNRHGRTQTQEDLITFLAREPTTRMRLPEIGEVVGYATCTVRWNLLAMERDGLITIDRDASAPPGVIGQGRYPRTYSLTEAGVEAYKQQQ